MSDQLDLDLALKGIRQKHNCEASVDDKATVFITTSGNEILVTDARSQGGEHQVVACPDDSSHKNKITGFTYAVVFTWDGKTWNIREIIVRSNVEVLHLMQTLRLDVPEVTTL